MIVNALSDQTVFSCANSFCSFALTLVIYFLLFQLTSFWHTINLLCTVTVCMLGLALGLALGDKSQLGSEQNTRLELRCSTHIKIESRVNYQD